MFSEKQSLTSMEHYLERTIGKIQWEKHPSFPETELYLSTAMAVIQEFAMPGSCRHFLLHTVSMAGCCQHAVQCNQRPREMQTIHHHVLIVVCFFASLAGRKASSDSGKEMVKSLHQAFNSVSRN